MTVVLQIVIWDHRISRMFCLRRMRRRHLGSRCQRLCRLSRFCWCFWKQPVAHRAIQRILYRHSGSIMQWPSWPWEVRASQRSTLGHWASRLLIFGTFCLDIILDDWNALMRSSCCREWTTQWIHIIYSFTMAAMLILLQARRRPWGMTQQHGCSALPRPIVSQHRLPFGPSRFSRWQKQRTPAFLRLECRALIQLANKTLIEFARSSYELWRLWLFVIIVPFH